MPRGSMMQPPLLLSDIIEFAAAQHPGVEVVSRETHGPLVRYTYADCAARARRLANALPGMGLARGDAVGSIAWNNHRHLEAYYAVSGSGMVMHTCNPRLHPDQLAYIIDHAEDKVVLYDATFAPLVERLAPRCPTVREWVCLADADHTPDIPGLPRTLAYEDLIAGHDPDLVWPVFGEDTAAALCYTSGTTGNPKGVLYSHRALALNAISVVNPDVFGLSARQTVLPVVPMFHINAWCLPYAAPLSGTRLVLPGPRLDGASLYELMEGERVTISAGVPAIWTGLVAHVERHGLSFSTLRMMAVGGAAMPVALIAKLDLDYGVEVRHGWGMTETTAVATISTLTSEHDSWSADRRHARMATQGKPVFGVEIKVVDEAGRSLPRDGVSQGELMVRGQWIVERYHKADDSPLVDGWFPTGDIAVIFPDGLMQIRDRTKDMIKTGGEWISSIDLENAAAGHPGVAMAAVIGVRHPQWDERPLLFVVPSAEGSVTKDEILAFLADRVASWWVPDDVVFLDSLPVGGTGKVQKAQLRQAYADAYS